MAIDIDPEISETQALFDFAGELAGLRVLEIGCGEGRLTWRYASQAAHVTAIDPDTEKVQRAISETPVALKDKIVFHACELEDFAAGVGLGQTFDLAILSWSL
jgi:2-polyprenyl-3-methyl-5-hydroxy-6-metoxy-1,4-benzoquinol methylase